MNNLLDALIRPNARVKISGLWGSSEPFLLSQLLQSGKSFCIVAPSLPQAETLYHNMLFFLRLMGPTTCPAPLFFPPWDVLPYEPTAPRIDRIAQRLSTLHQLTQNKEISVVTSVEAFLQRLMDPKFLVEQIEIVSQGEEISRESLVSRLIAKGYQPSDCVTQQGETAFRGGIVDFYPLASPQATLAPQESHSPRPVRIEFFGDRIEAIRYFDSVSQRSTKAIESVALPLAHEDLSDPHFYQTALTDYFSDTAILVLDEPDEVIQKGKRFLETVEEGALFTSQTNKKYPKPDKLYLSIDTVVAYKNRLDLELLSLRQERGATRFTFESRSKDSLRMDRLGQTFSEKMKFMALLRKDHQITIVVKNEQAQFKWSHLLEEHEFPWAFARGGWGSDVHFPAPIQIAIGEIEEGFVLSHGQDGAYPSLGKVAFFNEADLLTGTASRRRAFLPRTRTVEEDRLIFLSSFEDLKPLDYVVHLEQGIGRYHGLQRLTLRPDGRGPAYELDFLVLEYAGQDKLYVPLDSLNLIQRYMGLNNTAPRLDRLGGAQWANVKNKVKNQIKEMTQELLQLYAERAIVEGHPFSVSDRMFEAFEAGFEYEETPDQLKAIRDVMADMASPYPMDRLICGDVGYGKTEVAMRAAFLAAMEHKQTAILVPTTLLAQQHYETFSKRFLDFPVKVAVLSRFLSRSEQKGVLADLKKGIVDIVIGTQRLLQKDVQFLDLGLIVIDEEHRLGVRHKERMKQFKKQIDCLTLTATPIPRTLQMALSEIRPLSTILTPPVDRLAIRTILAPFDPHLIREAIFRELVRGGQVFFIHNVVHNIGQVAQFLAELLPEAKIGVAHGQMRPDLLENVMLKFVQKEYNLLVTTTIVESGIDIPSANTILINEADRFGLSELYQLRGRVGRSGEQAYAYLLVREGKTLTGEARERLQTLKEFTELGAGFRIAAKDLEIRGAGDLLGGKQSGNVAAVGFELYLKMIDEMVRELKGKPAKSVFEPQIRLPVSAHLPEGYIPDVGQRLSVYKRLNLCHNLEEIELLRSELLDWYGVMPDSVTSLLQVAQIKKMAQSVHIKTIEARLGTLHFVFDNPTGISENKLARLLDLHRGDIRFQSDTSFDIVITEPTWEVFYLMTMRCLSVFLGYQEKGKNGKNEGHL